ncbi:hypothetical protein [Vibrio campbellii]|uniref:hypothetical protein n=1 Tax=Vibrio campbellii TaxID=680 RepID=UPI00385788DC
MKAMSSFITQAKRSAFDSDDAVYEVRLSRAREIVEYILREPDKWSEKCTFNIEWIGDRFIENLRDYRADRTQEINDIYTASYRFLCEFDFFVGHGKSLTFELRSLKSSIQSDALKLDSEVSPQIVFASYLMPAEMTKKFVNSEGLEAVTTFEAKMKAANELKIRWDSELKQKEQVLTALSEKLDEFTTGYNFVGLYKGFGDLAKKKQDEQKLLLGTLIAMAVLILAPLVVQFTSNLGVTTVDISWKSLLSLAPLVSIEVILIYFFRIVLHNYKSVKTQIIQIELRQTLCQFIQKYAEYSSSIKENDPTALDKFENLIFSGILSDSEKLPTTFDGLENIGSLIKNIKGV